LVYGNTVRDEFLSQINSDLVLLVGIFFQHISPKKNLSIVRKWPMQDLEESEQIVKPSLQAVVGFVFCRGKKHQTHSD